jgi:transcriptional regulator with PAS, ATPase and Fis domain
MAKGQSLFDVERQIILETLKSYGNNKTKTAQALGIGRWTLYRKLKSQS